MTSRTCSILLAALVVVACRSEPKPQAAAPESQTSQSATAPTPPSATAPTVDPRPELREQTERVELGYSASSSGAIVEGQKSRRFLRGLSFVLAVRTGDLPSGTELAVRWKNAAGDTLASSVQETHGGSFMDFPSPDTAQWPGGQYRVETQVGGEQQRAIEFEVAGNDGSTG